MLRDQGAAISVAPCLPPIHESLKELGTSGAPVIDFFTDYDHTGVAYWMKGKEGGGGGGEVSRWSEVHGRSRRRYVGYDLVRVDYESSNGKKETLDASFLISADGPSSTVRKLMLPESERTWAGYVAWRRNAEESEISRDTLNFMGESVTFFYSKGGHILHYKIPGYYGSLKEGDKMCNVVWYYNVDQKQFEKVFTDSNGQSHEFSLGVGKIRPEIRDE
ncbi:hypothetical protein BDZ45DRAFT_752971 [Acephala macrosclerotiorum]|nr:hypothetical protein BDZ45DRAFT_752971 [Acephala macrosclerotiorum]